MNYLGDNKFNLTIWDKTKKFVISTFYPLCLIPYLFLLTYQPFRCILFSFLISWFGCLILLLARWQNENLGLLKWAIYLSLIPGLICLIFSPALLMQMFHEIFRD